jgi:hypothetical protein
MLLSPNLILIVGTGADKWLWSLVDLVDVGVAVIDVVAVVNNVDNKQQVTLVRKFPSIEFEIEYTVMVEAKIQNKCSLLISLSGLILLDYLAAISTSHDQANSKVKVKMID